MNKIKNIIIWGLVFSLTSPLFAYKVIKYDEETKEVIVMDKPDIIKPNIVSISIDEIEKIPAEVLPVIIEELSIKDIEALEPETVEIILKRITPEGIKAISSEKLSVSIKKVRHKKLLKKVLKKIAPAGVFRIEEREFFRNWKKKDVKELAKLIKQTRETKEISFFLAWGNYKNFDEIDWNRYEPEFDYRQVLISGIGYDWRENFKPNGGIILTIDFGLNNVEIKSLLDLIKENKDKIKLIILPWGKPLMNCFDNRDVSTYKEISIFVDKLFYSIKEVAPEIPIYLTVAFTPTMDEWVKSFEGNYDGIALWNIVRTDKSNLKKVFDIVSKYNKNIILSGIFQCQPDRHWIDFEEAKEITLKTYKRAKNIGIKGIILMTNK